MPASASATSPLVSPQWLADRMGSDDLVVLEYQPLRYYTQAHIPGSVHTSYSRWRMTDANGLGQMLPDVASLQVLIGDLGITRQSQVVIAPTGQGAGDWAAAARLYWTLYVAGLENIKILDGGLLAWYDAFGEAKLAQGRQPPKAASFKVSFRDEQILTMDKVSAYLKKQHSIVDARSPAEFSGAVAGAVNERPGALPTAVNLPYDSLMRADQRGLKSLVQLKQLFQSSSVPLDGPQVSYCHTGHRTALLWFVSHELLGNTEARLYDGSTLEWSATSDRPLVLSGS